MIGYHYTTKENWEEIQKTGLLPQLINKPEIEQEILWATKKNPGDIKACWVWERRQEGITGLGHVMMVHEHHKQSETFVELQVDFDPKTESLQLPVHDGNPRNIQVYHSGTIDLFGKKVEYHRQEPVKLVTAVIPPERIQLLDSYDFTEIKKKVLTHFDMVDTSA